MRASLLLLLLFMVFIFGSGQRHGLWGTDEPREAEVAREMYASGDWVVPKINGLPFLEKPPLTHWPAVFIFEYLGRPSEEWCRVPSILWGIAGTLAAVWLGRMAAGPRVGILAGFVLATSFEWLYAFHSLRVDAPLASCVSMLFALFWFGYTANDPSRKRIAYLGCSIAAAGAFLAKGGIGVVIPASGIVAFLLWRRERSEIARLMAPRGIILFLAVAAPWLVMLGLRGGGEALKIFWWDNHVIRFFSSRTTHARPYYFYLHDTPVMLLPWTIFLLPALIRIVKTRPGCDPAGAARQYLISIIAVPFVILSMAKGKRSIYMLPMIPIFAILIAAWLDGAWSAMRERWERGWIYAGLVVLSLLPVGAWGMSLFLSLKSGIGTGSAVSGTIFGAVGSVASMVYLARHGGRRAVAYAVALVIMAYGAVLSPSVWALLDAHRGYGKITGWLDLNVGPDDRLYEFIPDEQIQSVVAFHRGQPVPMIGTLRGLKNVIRASPRNVVLMHDERYEMLLKRFSRKPRLDISHCETPRRTMLLLRKKRQQVPVTPCASK